MKAIWFLHWLWGAATGVCWLLPWIMDITDKEGTHLEFLFLVPGIAGTLVFLCCCTDTLVKKAQTGE